MKNTQINKIKTCVKHVALQTHLAVFTWDHQCLETVKQEKEDEM